MSASANQFAVVRAKLKFATRDEFVQGFAPLVSTAGLFVRTKSTKPVGTPVKFEFRLADSTPIFVGEGVVRKEVPFDESQPQRPCGMLVGLRRMNRTSKEVLDEILRLKGLAAEAPEDAEPEDAEPEDAEPEDAEPEEAAPEEAAPEDAAVDAADSSDGAAAVDEEEPQAAAPAAEPPLETPIAATPAEPSAAVPPAAVPFDEAAETPTPPSPIVAARQAAFAASADAPTPAPPVAAVLRSAHSYTQPTPEPARPAALVESAAPLATSLAAPFAQDAPAPTAPALFAPEPATPPNPLLAAPPDDGGLAELGFRSDPVDPTDLGPKAPIVADQERHDSVDMPAAPEMPSILPVAYDMATQSGDDLLSSDDDDDDDEGFGQSTSLLSRPAAYDDMPERTPAPSFMAPSAASYVPAEPEMATPPPYELPAPEAVAAPAPSYELATPEVVAPAELAFDAGLSGLDEAPALSIFGDSHEEIGSIFGDDNGGEGDFTGGLFGDGIDSELDDMFAEAGMISDGGLDLAGPADFSGSALPEFNVSSGPLDLAEEGGGLIAFDEDELDDDEDFFDVDGGDALGDDSAAPLMHGDATDNDEQFAPDMAEEFDASERTIQAPPPAALFARGSSLAAALTKLSGKGEAAAGEAAPPEEVEELEEFEELPEEAAAPAPMFRASSLPPPKLPSASSLPPPRPLLPPPTGQGLSVTLPRPSAPLGTTLPPLGSTPSADDGEENPLDAISVASADLPPPPKPKGFSSPTLDSFEPNKQSKKGLFNKLFGKE